MILGMVSTSLGTFTLHAYGWDKPALDVFCPMGPQYWPDYWNVALDKCAAMFSGEVMHRATVPAAKEGLIH